MPENMITSLGYNEQALKLCIDDLSNNAVKGRVVSMRLSQPINFVSLNDFIMKMDAVMDAQNFPQSFQRKREFKTKKGGAGAGQGILSAIQGTPITRDELDAAAGLVATVTVRVLSRQNATWQGHVLLPGRQGPIAFDSELGLLQIISEHLFPNA